MASHTMEWELRGARRSDELRSLLGNRFCDRRVRMAYARNAYARCAIDEFSTRVVINVRAFAANDGQFALGIYVDRIKLFAL